MANGPKKLLPFPSVPPLIKGAALAVGIAAAGYGCDDTMSPVDSGIDAPMPAPFDAGDVDAFLPPPMPAPMVDTGPPDIDAGPEDAGPTDAGPTDAGPTDAGPTDAGPADAGSTDADVIAPMPPPEPDGGIIIAPMPPPMPAPMPAPDPDPAR